MPTSRGRTQLIRSGLSNPGENTTKPESARQQVLVVKGLHVPGARPAPQTTALVWASSGRTGLLFGTSLLAPGLDLNVVTHRVLDSNLRFFGGLWLGLGVCLLWCLRDLAARAGIVTWLWAFIFLGGIGRALAIFQVGWPPAPFIFFTALELVGAPLFVWWLARLTSVPGAIAPAHPTRSGPDHRATPSR